MIRPVLLPAPCRNLLGRYRDLEVLSARNVSSQLSILDLSGPTVRLKYYRALPSGFTQSFLDGDRRSDRLNFLKLSGGSSTSIKRVKNRIPALSQATGFYPFRISSVFFWDKFSVFVSCKRFKISCPDKILIYVVNAALISYPFFRGYTFSMIVSVPPHLPI